MWCPTFTDRSLVGSTQIGCCESCNKMQPRTGGHQIWPSKTGWLAKTYGSKRVETLGTKQKASPDSLSIPAPGATAERIEPWNGLCGGVLWLVSVGVAWASQRAKAVPRVGSQSQWTGGQPNDPRRRPCEISVCLAGQTLHVQSTVCRLIPRRHQQLGPDVGANLAWIVIDEMTDTVMRDSP